LAWLSHKRGYWRHDARLLRTLQKLAIAALAMALLLALSRPLMGDFASISLGSKLAQLTVVIGLAGALYLLLLGWLRVYSWQDLKTVRSFFKRNKTTKTS
jgi:hypothetical protein